VSRSDADFSEYAAGRWSNLYRTAYVLCPDPATAANRSAAALSSAYTTWRARGATDDSDAHVRRALVRVSASGRTRRLWTREVAPATAPPYAGTDGTLPSASHEQVLEMLLQLPPGPRLVLVLRCLHDLRPREIAELLGWKPDTVLRLAAAGLQRLEVLLADESRTGSDRAQDVVPMRQDLRDAVQGALAEVPVPPLRTEHVLSAGRSSRNRRRVAAAYVLVAAAAMAVAAAALTLPEPGGEAPDASPTSDRSTGQVAEDVLFWDGLGVPWIHDGRVVHGSASLPRPAGLAALAATADSVVMTIGDKRAMIVELRPDGTVAVIGQDAIGTARADTSGRVAAWTEARGEGWYRVVAYDTAAHRVIATLEVHRGMRVQALHDRNLVLHDRNGDYVWTAGLDTGLVPFEPGGGGFTVKDLTYSHIFVAAPGQGARLLDRSGRVLESFPHTSVRSGAFDPGGRFVSGLRAQTSPASMYVYDLENERLVELNAPGNIDWTRWTPDSRLVLRSSMPNLRPSYEHLPVFYFVCEPRNGRCIPLADGAATPETTEGVGVDFLGEPRTTGP
jgi:DNA-directed RNA polymerase specialized sigma24 family protein